ncbi:MAG: 6-carboxytetrahydropterin synthase QueD [Pseudomonadota bacterium]|nr:6-carboxytetrahydropterin synthase QueD [Pseudomonadota bacterium]MED5274893.1 6-carboxytetrahydropterin synthase QueD [Pseudomonadota bacterium]
MYTLTIKTEFSSAHILNGHKGDCKRMHGHNWKVEVEVSGNKLDNIGMVMDFKDIKKSAKEIGGRLDHQFLNDLEPFKENNPTAENIAKYFFSELSKKINNDSIELKSIKLWETDKSAVKYTE